MMEFENPNGRFVRTDMGHKAFVPSTLPPEFDVEELVPLISEASNLVGRLGGMGRGLEPRLLVRAQMINEAVQSSKIEGSQVSLSDLYYHRISPAELESYPIGPSEVNSYTEALEVALEKISNGANIDLDLMNECHKILMRHNQRVAKGAFRERQNWIASEGSNIENAKYVPPPPKMVPNLMDDLVEFMRNPPRRFVPLLQCAIVHYQFEAIHPYEDGNGRIGRMLIPLMLAERNILDGPLLYLSKYIADNKSKYYKLLLDVSSDGQWTEWIRFFLMAVIEQARSYIDMIKKLDKLYNAYRDRAGALQVSINVVDALDIVFDEIYITRRMIADGLDVSDATAKNIVDKLVEIGILEYAETYKTRKVYLAREVFSLIAR